MRCEGAAPPRKAKAHLPAPEPEGLLRVTRYGGGGRRTKHKLEDFSSHQRKLVLSVLCRRPRPQDGWATAMMDAPGSADHRRKFRESGRAYRQTWTDEDMSASFTRDGSPLLPPSPARDRHERAARRGAARRIQLWYRRQVLKYATFGPMIFTRRDGKIADFGSLSFLGGTRTAHFLVAFVAVRLPDVDGPNTPLRLQPSECDLATWVPLKDVTTVLCDGDDFNSAAGGIADITYSPAKRVVESDGGEAARGSSDAPSTVGEGILAARMRGIYPNAHEEGIGRGHLFALRCLARATESQRQVGLDPSDGTSSSIEDAPQM